MSRIRCFFSVLLLWPIASLALAEQNILRDISYGPKDEFSFKLAATDSHYRYFMLSKPNRLVIDFVNTQLKHSLAQPPSDHPLFLKLRTGERNGKDLRMVLELKAQAEAADTLQKKPQGSELAFNLLRYHLPVVQPVSKAEKLGTNVVRPAANAINDKHDKLVAVTPAPTQIPVKQLKPQVPPSKGRDIVVAIDAGHGGKDVGAQGNNGTQEKDVVFAIAKKLEYLVNAQTGMHAVMIRKGDYFVKLHDRVGIAHNAKADLFVSIHADAFNDTSAHGASVYTLANKGASSEGARWLADSENAVDTMGGVSLVERNDALVSVLQDLSQTAAKEASQNIGNKVLKNVRSVGHLHRTAVQKAGFVVLKSPDIPSILVETAFISNPEEEMRLNTHAYQEKMARAVFSGIIAHFRQYAPANTLFAQLSKANKVSRVALAVEEPVPVETAKPELIAKAEENNANNSKLQHVVNSGETLSGIAQQYGISMRALRLANNMSDGNVKKGGVLQIPPNG